MWSCWMTMSFMKIHIDWPPLRDSISIHLFQHNCSTHDKHNKCFMIVPGLELLFSICKIKYKIIYKLFYICSVILVYVSIINIWFSVYAHVSLKWNCFQQHSFITASTPGEQSGMQNIFYQIRPNALSISLNFEFWLFSISTISLTHTPNPSHDAVFKKN